MSKVIDPGLTIWMEDAKPKVAVGFPPDVNVGDFAAVLFFLCNGGMVSDIRKAVSLYGAANGLGELADQILEQYDAITDQFIEEMSGEDENPHDKYRPRNTMKHVLNYSKNFMES